MRLLRSPLLSSNRRRGLRIAACTSWLEWGQTRCLGPPLRDERRVQASRPGARERGAVRRAGTCREGRSPDGAGGRDAGMGEDHPGARARAEGWRAWVHGGDRALSRTSGWRSRSRRWWRGNAPSARPAFEQRTPSVVAGRHSTPRPGIDHPSALCTRPLTAGVTHGTLCAKSFVSERDWPTGSRPGVSRRAA